MKPDIEFWGTFFAWVVVPMFLLCLIFSCRSVVAFPEMVRHGYPQCITCHYSPSGGGLLTPYGKVQGDELLATWSLGAEPSLSPVSLGAQLRVLQLQSDSKKAFRQAFILMQSDAEGAATVGPITAVGTVGADGNGAPFSRRHYAIGKISDSLHLRLGKFIPFFGLGLPDHNLSIRQHFGPGDERYALEMGVTYEKGSTVATYSKGEGIVRQSFNVGTGQIGFGLRGTGQVFEGGAFALWPLPYDFLFLAEAIFAERAHRGYGRIQYQVTRGLAAYLHSDANLARLSGGLGLQFVPINGVEVRAEMNKTDTGCLAFFMGNLWL